MTKSVASIISVLFVSGLAGSALGQDQPAVSGTVESVDSMSRTIVLDDGQSYTLNETADMNELEQGSDVSISCESTNADCMVLSVSTMEMNDPASTREAPSSTEDAPETQSD